MCESDWHSIQASFIERETESTGRAHTHTHTHAHIHTHTHTGSVSLLKQAWTLLYVQHRGPSLSLGPVTCIQSQNHLIS